MLSAIFRALIRSTQRRPALWPVVPLLLAAALITATVFKPRNSNSRTISSPTASNTDSASNTSSPVPGPAELTRDIQVLQETTAKSLNKPVQITNSLGMKLRLIPSGRFDMGSPASEEGRDTHEGPQHQVEISTPFYAGVTEVTRAEWRAIMGTEPWQNELPASDDRCPATFVSWHDALKFSQRLSERECQTYRLPTEAEWEWLCRAGTDTSFSFGKDPSLLIDYAWFEKNANSRATKYAQPAAQKKPNPLGLHDVHGNVREWCSDWYSATYYGHSLSQDPAGPETGAFRVLRGGSWYSRALRLRSADRVYSAPDFRGNGVGFRVILQPTRQPG